MHSTQDFPGNGRRGKNKRGGKFQCWSPELGQLGEIPFEGALLSAYSQGQYVCHKVEIILE
jgi:hypothetical protein